MIKPVEAIPLDRAEDLIAHLRPHTQRWQPHPAKWIYRGQCDSKHKLLPTAYREEAWKDFTLPGEEPFNPLAGYHSEIVQAQREYKTLKRFLEGIDRSGIGIPEDIFVRTRLAEADQNDLDFLTDPAIVTFAALAQHHGVPTRLLDWTRSALHAAYFGAARVAPRASEGGSMSVWALSQEFVEHARTRERQVPHTPRLHVMASPRATNPNLHAQAGVFTMWLNTARVTDLEEVILQMLLALDRTDGCGWDGPSPLCRLQLPWSETPKLLRMLSYEQVDAARMFPDRDGVVRALKERRYWDQKE